MIVHEPTEQGILIARSSSPCLGAWNSVEHDA